MDDDDLIKETMARIIAAAEESGTSLITIHKHYPTGWAAVSLGFLLAMGVFMFGAVVAISDLLNDWLFS